MQDNASHPSVEDNQEVGVGVGVDVKVGVGLDVVVGVGVGVSLDAYVFDMTFCFLVSEDEEDGEFR